MKDSSETKWERTRAKGLPRYVLRFSLIQCGTLALVLAGLALVRRFVFAVDSEYAFPSRPDLFVLLLIGVISPLWALANWHLAEREYRRKVKFYGTCGSTLGLGK